MKSAKQMTAVFLCLCLLLAGCGSRGKERGFTDFAHVQAEYRSAVEKLNWPEGAVLPDGLEADEEGTSYQEGYGDTMASNLWEYQWMQAWLDTYQTDPAKAEKALAELETAFAMPYMGEDRCDDATRRYLRENIDKARNGDPSGFEECIRVNFQ